MLATLQKVLALVAFLWILFSLFRIMFQCHSPKSSHPVYYHVRNESPVYVRCRIQDAWGWCTGMIQRDDMGWEGVHVWELMYTHGRFILMYGKTNTVL